MCGSHGWPEAGVGGTEGWPYASVLDEDHQDAEGGRFLANGEAGVDSFKQRVICLLEGAVISSFVGGGVKDEADVLADVVSTSCFVLIISHETIRFAHTSRIYPTPSQLSLYCSLHILYWHSIPSRLRKVMYWATAMWQRAL